MSEYTDKLDLKLFEMVQKIKSALGTEEDGEALIQVARNAHRAEMELAALKRKLDKLDYTPDKVLELLQALEDGKFGLLVSGQ